MRIRKMQPQDAQAVKSIEDQVFFNSLIKFTEDDIKAWASNPYKSYVLENESSQIIGHIIIYFNNNTLHIFNLCIHPRFQKMGLGCQLMRHVEKKNAEKFKKSDIRLWVEINNSNVCKFYERLGYRKEHGTETHIHLFKSIIMRTSAEEHEDDNQLKITIIGDSTIDNKLWVSPGIYFNFLFDKLGIKRDDSATRIQKSHTHFRKPELSVVENLIDMMPNYHISDYTNDGFTTADCLHGDFKDKVFGNGTFVQFPHDFFQPLKEGADAIKASQHIILSVGGNDFREFLMSAHRIDEKSRSEFVKQAFPQVLTDLKTQYIQIVFRIRQLNPNAKIILMTQYYPSVSQNNYKIYPFMMEIGRALNVGENPNNSMDVIHSLIQSTYRDALAEINDSNVVVADITSSLDPFDSNNHVSQIEPSGEGGRKIALMLKYIITSAQAGFVYRFLPAFFKNQSHDHVQTYAFKNWTPKHPHEFSGQACHTVSTAMTSLIANFTIEEQNNLNQNLELQKALIVLHQVSPDLVNRDNFSKLLTNTDLTKILAAAHGYLNSGRFGFFRTHGRHGKQETEKFVRSVIQTEKPGYDLKKEISNWLKSSNVNNSSRAFYACKFFTFKNGFQYATASSNERKEALNSILYFLQHPK